MQCSRARGRPARPRTYLVLDLQRGLQGHGLVEALLPARREREGEVAVQRGLEAGRTPQQRWRQNDQEEHWEWQPGPAAHPGRSDLGLEESREVWDAGVSALRSRVRANFRRRRLTLPSKGKRRPPLGWVRAGLLFPFCTPLGFGAWLHAGLGGFGFPHTRQ